MPRKRDIEAGDSPPAVLPVCLDGIPAELRDCGQWVLWSYLRKVDQRGKAKWTKVPTVLATQAPASSTDPGTWSKFDDVATFYGRKLATRSPFPGIGFVFHHDDPFCGVDLDDCRDPATGEIAPWATDFILRLASYAEVSPSGTGVKIILRGHVPGGRRKMPFAGGVFEVYDCGRFFTVTGRHLEGTPETVNDAQDALDAIYHEVFAEADAEALPPTPLAPPPGRLDLPDSELLDRMFASSSGAKLLELWHGDTAAHGDDHSAADLSLCSSLAWWCQGDAARIDRLFRQSGLMRPKWDSKNGSGTYGSRTVARALRGLGAGYDPAGYRAAQVAAAVQAATQVPTTGGAGTGGAGSTGTTTTVTPSGSGDNGTPQTPPTLAATQAQQQPHVLTNFVRVPGEVDGNGRQTFTQRGLSADEIARPLLAATGDWPRRIRGSLFVLREGVTPTANVSGQFRWLESQSDLFGWASAALRRGGFGNPVNWATRSADLLTKGEFLSHLGSVTHAYDGILHVPHEPPLPDYYYCPCPQEGGDGTALHRYLSFFSPASDIDADLLLSLLLTAVWGGPPGQRPAFVFVATAADREKRGRGVGKSTAAQEVARLFDGFVRVRPSDDFDKVKTRLLSPGAAAIRFAFIDNVKSLRLSWSDLEDAITGDCISGHGMWEGEARRPNYLIWLMTYNGVQLSSDLASRCVIIHLARPAYRGNWKADLDAFFASHRWAIIGDLIAVLRGPTQTINAGGRWAMWEQAILSRVRDPRGCQDAVRERQGEADDDDDFAELVADEFASTLRRNGYTQPARSVVFFTSGQAVAILGRVARDYRSIHRGVPFLAQLGVKELRKKKLTDARGFLWVGQDAAYQDGDDVQRFSPNFPEDKYAENDSF